MLKSYLIWVMTLERVLTSNTQVLAAIAAPG